MNYVNFTRYVSNKNIVVGPLYLYLIIFQYYPVAKALNRQSSGLSNPIL